MLERVLSSPLSACFKSTVVYQYNGQPLLWRQRGASGCSTRSSEGNLRLNRVVKALSSDTKGEILLKKWIWYMFKYDNELDCSFGSKKAHIDAFLCWLFLSDSTKTL